VSPEAIAFTAVGIVLGAPLLAGVMALFVLRHRDQATGDRDYTKVVDAVIDLKVCHGEFVDHVRGQHDRLVEEQRALRDEIRGKRAERRPVAFHRPGVDPPRSRSRGINDPVYYPEPSEDAAAPGEPGDAWDQARVSEVAYRPDSTEGHDFATRANADE
jgi:hypothetical protein